MKRYEGKVCLVTAGSTGIGLAIAERMAFEGGNLYICSLENQDVEQGLKQINAAIK